jgi:diguanylate cyclase (GGDEF)-like protein
MRQRQGGQARERRDPDLRPIPAHYNVYAAGVASLALGTLGLVALGYHWNSVVGEPALWFFAALVLVGELLPIQVPHRYSYDRVHVSTAFAFTILIAFGSAPALVVYGVCSVIADRAHRTPAIISVFNAGQYVLAMGAAGGVLSLLGSGPPVDSVASALPGVLLAGATFFALNHVLAGASSALLTKSKLIPYLRADLAYYVWTDGFQIALSPLIVVASEASLWLVPVACLPVLTIFLGGRQAAINGYRASHDELTDLPNRWVFNGRLEEAVREAEVGGGKVVLLILDLDDFKLVNDTLGHHSGDDLLRQVAHRLRRVTREDDVLARLGGDEFAVLLKPDSDHVDGREVAERLLAEFEPPFEIESLHLDVAASVGVASTAAAGEQASDLMRSADDALYEAKASGANCVVSSDRPSVDRRDERLGLSSDLRDGIGRGELFLEFQPKLALTGNGPQGAEALVRWKHPRLGVMAPGAFVLIAEQSGLIKALTLRVLESAIIQAREWERSGTPIRVSVNLSTRNLLDRELPADVARLLNVHGLPPRLLQLEVTESRVAADLNRTRTVLEELRDMGLTIAIDDFGTGFSSLTQLQQLPVDEIKIDKSFVLGMDASRQDAAIVRSTIDLGRNLGLAVTAEGVESQEVLTTLTDLGCDSLQGFFIGRPQAADACARTLHDYVDRVPRRRLTLSDLSVPVRGQDAISDPPATRLQSTA